MNRLRLVASTAAIALGLGLGLSLDAEAHEFWIDPVPFQPEVAGSSIRADLRVGQGFSAEAYPYLSSNFHTFRLAVRGQAYDVRGNEGDVPAIDVKPAPAGLSVISYYGKPNRVTFEDAALFASYLELEGLGWVTKAHAARGLPAVGFTEAFSRNVKSLVQTGPVSAEDVDIVTGMPFELVAGRNPHADPAQETLPVTLLWQGQPAADIQITIFQDAGFQDAGSKNAGTPTRQVLRTDAEGKATIPLAGGGRFILNAVHMREAPAELDAAWESHWASLTFALPKR
ncbi:MAG: DUF4198 domain-containing protein [Rhizobiaceae bacterium]|nr:DUF4198 domain-containing protein [Rhizobiaceae bacterium]